MITLKCRHCDASLKRVDGVLTDTRHDTASPWDVTCPESDGKHVARKLRQVQITGWVSVDDDAWTLAYGTPTDEITADVRATVGNTLQGLVTDELMIRDTMVRGA